MKELIAYLRQHLAATLVVTAVPILVLVVAGGKAQGLDGFRFDLMGHPLGENAPPPTEGAVYQMQLDGEGSGGDGDDLLIGGSTSHDPLEQPPVEDGVPDLIVAPGAAAPRRLLISCTCSASSARATHRTRTCS